MKTDQFINTLVQDLGTPTAQVGPLLGRLLPVAALVTAVGFLAIAGIRADVVSTGLPPTLLKFALGASLAAVGVVGALRLSRPAHGVSKPRALLLVAPFAAALIAVTDLTLFGGGNWQARLLGKNVWACLTAIPLLAALPFAAAMFALRNGATELPAVSGALAGIGSAGLAIVAYGLFCTEDTALFIAAWYVLAACIAGLVGAVVGRAVLRW